MARYLCGCKGRGALVTRLGVPNTGAAAFVQGRSIGARVEITPCSKGFDVARLYIYDRDNGSEAMIFEFSEDTWPTREEVENVFYNRNR